MNRFTPRRLSHGRRTEAGSPAEVFFAAYVEATKSLHYGDVTEDTGTLERLADAFRAAERATVEWLMERGWPRAVAREIGQAYLLAAGDWLLMEQCPDEDALLFAVRAVAVP